MGIVMINLIGNLRCYYRDYLVGTILLLLHEGISQKWGTNNI